MWSVEPWAVIMTLVLGLGCGLFAYYATNIWHLKQRSRSFQRWAEDLRYKAIRVIDTDAEAAEAKRELFEAVGEMPNDFDPTMFLAVDLATGIQRAVLYTAEQKGLVEAGTFERVFGRPMPTPPSKLLELPTEVQGLAPPRTSVPDDIHDVAWTLKQEG